MTVDACFCKGVKPVSDMHTIHQAGDGEGVLFEQWAGVNGGRSLTLLVPQSMYPVACNENKKDPVFSAV
jgi:hypothetical protein